MFKKLILNIALVWLFALTQAAIVTHELSHLKQLTQQTQPDKNTPQEHCAQCLTMAQAEGALPSTAFSLPLAVHSQALTYIVSCQYAQRSLRAYAARAPPTFILA